MSSELNTNKALGCPGSRHPDLLLYSPGELFVEQMAEKFSISLCVRKSQMKGDPKKLQMRQQGGLYFFLLTYTHVLDDWVMHLTSKRKLDKQMSVFICCDQHYILENEVQSIRKGCSGYWSGDTDIVVESQKVMKGTASFSAQALSLALSVNNRLA